MKKWIMCAAAFALSTGIALAESTTTVKQGKEGQGIDPSAVTQITVSGTVEHADSEARILVLKDKNGVSRTYTVPPKCNVRRGNKYINLSELVKGDTATLTCTVPTTQCDVNSISADEREKNK